MYTRAPWSAGRGGSSTPALSDTESETSVSDAGSISRSSSTNRVKRTISEASDCSELGEEVNGSEGGRGGPRTASGTWPRLPKRSSRASSLRDAHDTLDVWELTRALAREKSDLADQMSRLTSEVESGSSPTRCVGSSSSWDEIGSQDPRMDELDELVEAEQRGADGAEVDDGTVNAILGALQNQFKPDHEGSLPNPPAQAAAMHDPSQHHHVHAHAHAHGAPLPRPRLMHTRSRGRMRTWPRPSTMRRPHMRRRTLTRSPTPTCTCTCTCTCTACTCTCTALHCHCTATEGSRRLLWRREAAAAPGRPLRDPTTGHPGHPPPPCHPVPP